MDLKKRRILLTLKNTLTFVKDSLVLWVVLLVSFLSLTMGCLGILKGWKLIYDLNQLNQGFLVTEATVVDREVTVPYKGPNYYILHYQYTIQTESQPSQTFTGNDTVPEVKYNDTQIGDSVTIIYAISDISVSQIKQGLKIRGNYYAGWVGIGISIFWVLLSFVVTCLVVMYLFVKRQEPKIITTHTIGDQEIRVVQTGWRRYIEVWNTKTGELVSRKRA